MTEATVVYNAIANFAALRDEIKALRAEVRELEAEEKAFNNSPDKAKGLKLRADSVKAIDEESKALTRSARSAKENNAETERSSKIMAGLTDSIAKQSRVSEDSIKTTTRQKEALRDLGTETDSVTSSASRLTITQAGAAREARRWAEETRKAADEAARASRGAADDIERDALRSARARAQERDALGRFTSKTPAGSSDGGGSPPIPVPNLGDSSGNAGRDIQSVLKGISKTLGDVAGKVLTLFQTFIKLGSIGAAIGPGIAALVALGASILSVIGSASEMLGIFLALPAALAVAGISIAALVVATRGITNAFKAYSAQQKTSADDALKASRTQRDATEAVAAAERSLARAREDSVRSGKDNSQRVADAERSLAEAKFQAARSEIDTKQRVEDAERSLTAAQQAQARNQVDAADRVVRADENLEKAQRHLVTSQNNLNDARVQALKDLVALRREVEHGTLNEEAAVADLAKAQEAYNKVLADPGATEADRVSSLSNLHEAQQRVIDVQDKAKEAEQNLADAAKKGVEGSDKVVNAKENLTTAEENLKDATKETIRSREDQARSEIDNAERVDAAERELARAREDRARFEIESPLQIAAAERALSRAKEDQARSLVDSAQRIADAERALTKAREAQQDSITNGNTKLKAYQDALNKLSPSAQTFVKSIVSMKDAWDGLRKSVQEAFFAPLIPQLDGIKKALPEVERNLTLVAGALGRVLASWIKWLTDPSLRPFFRNLADSTARIVGILGPTFLNVFKGFFDLITAGLPYIEKFAKSAADAAQNFADWASNTGKVSDVLRRATGRIGEFWQIIKDLASAYISLLKAATPFNDWVLHGLGDATAKFKEWAKAQEVDDSPFKRYLENIKPLLHEIGQLLKQFTDYIFHQSADPKNISKAVELLELIRSKLGPALGKLFDNLRDSGILDALVKKFTSIIDVINTFLEKGGGVGFVAFLTAVTALFRTLNSLLNALPSGVVTALGIALAGMALLKFTGILALISAIGKMDLGKLRAILGAVGRLGGVGAVAGAGAAAIGGVVAGKFVGDTLNDAGRGGANNINSKTTTGLVAGAGIGAGVGLLGGPFAPISVPVGAAAGAAIGGIAGFASGGGFGGADGILGKAKKLISELKKLFGPDFQKIFDTVKDKIVEAFDKIQPQLIKLKDSFAKLVAAATPLVELIFVPLVGALKVLSSIISDTLGPVLDFIIGGIAALLRALTGIIEFITGVFTGDWALAWQGIKDIFGGIWDAIVNVFRNVPEIIFGVVRGLVEGVVKFFQWLFDKLIGHSIIPDLINGIIGWFTYLPKLVLKIIGDFVDAAVKAFKGVWSGISKAFDGVGDIVAGAFGGIKKGFEAGFNGIKSAMSSFIDALGKIWHGIGRIFAIPVEFVINNVLDAGIIQGANFILDKLHLPQLPRIHFKWNFAKGGEIPGEGDEDNVPILATPGEFVMRKSAVKRIGLEKLHKMNTGQDEELKKYSMGDVIGEPKKYVGGGPIGAIKKGVSAVGAGIGNVVDFAAEAAKKAAIAGLELSIKIARKALDLLPGGPALGIPKGVINSVLDGILTVVKGNSQDRRNDPSAQQQQAGNIGNQVKFSKGGLVGSSRAKAFMQYASGGVVKNSLQGTEFRSFDPNLSPVTNLVNATGLPQPISQTVPRRSGLGTLDSTRITTHETTNNRGFTIENLNITNPVAETSSDSLARTVRKIAYLGDNR